MPDTPVDDDSLIIEQIYNEEDLSQRLDKLSSTVELPWKIVWNYWKGVASGDYSELQSILQEMAQDPLTKEGKFRLQARAKTLLDKVQPSFSRMAIQLWPILAFAVVKSVILPIISKKAKLAYRTARINKLRGMTKNDSISNK